MTIRSGLLSRTGVLDLVCLIVKRTLRPSERQRPVVGISGPLSTRDCPSRAIIRESVKGIVLMFRLDMRTYREAENVWMARVAKAPEV